MYTPPAKNGGFCTLQKLNIAIAEKLWVGKRLGLRLGYGLFASAFAVSLREGRSSRFPGYSLGQELVPRDVIKN